MPRSKAKTPRKVSEATSRANDYFSNPAARMGWGTPSQPEATEYQMVRLSNNYWLMITLYRNNWVIRRLVDLPAQDMTRAWPRITSQMPPDDIKRFDRTVARTQTPSRIRQALKWSRLFGGSGCIIAIEGHENKLDTPLHPDDVNPGTYRGLIPFDMWSGITPTGDVENDLSKPHEWGLPRAYTVNATDSQQSFEVHASRILRFTGPEIPTPELQAQRYWGLSIIEVVYEELRKRDNASWAILNLLFRANVLAQVNPALAALQSGIGGSQKALANWYMRMGAQNELLSNQSMLILPEDGKLESFQYTFGGIGEVYAQFQMDLAGAGEMTVTRLFGRTITGLGQTNDADERLYEDRIGQEQDGNVRPQLNKLYPIICMSELGYVPDDLDFKFPSIRVLTEEDKGDIAEKLSAPILAAYNVGAFGRKTLLKELRQLSDVTGAFSNITDEMIDEADDEPIPMGMDPEGEVPYKPNPNRAEKQAAGGAET